MHPVLCHFLRSTSYLLFNVEADLFTFPSFSRGFLLSTLSTFLIVVAFFWGWWCCKTHQVLWAFLFLIKFFILHERGHFLVQNIGTNLRNIIFFFFSLWLCLLLRFFFLSRVLFRCQMNRHCSWMKPALTPLARDFRRSAQALQQSAGDLRQVSSEGRNGKSCHRHLVNLRIELRFSSLVL